MTSAATAVPLTAHDGSVHRRVRITPSMCGNNFLLVAQMGDWTWDTVSSLCGTDVLTATNAAGAQTYLAFYYFHVRADPTFHPGALRFGDHLDITSKSFNFGSESILTLHRVRKAPDGHALQWEPFEAEELFERPRPGCLYVQNFNRWIARSHGNMNENLVKSSPVGFRYEHLPVLPEEHSPRRVYGDARAKGTFHDEASPGYRLSVERFPLRYAVDPTRDVNGVGLIYFASYFSMVDWAMLQLSRHLGRGDRAFLSRVVLDQQVCFLGNAELDSTFDIDVRVWESVRGDGEEIFNVTIREGTRGRDIAVATVKVRFGEVSGGSRG